MSESSPIAVIGMGCRLPGGASSPEKLWEMLVEGRSGWGEVPAERWNWKSFYHPHNEAKESLNSKSGYFLEQDIGAFDAKFFNIASYEAHAMDPQQRILLGTTYEALENAGIPLDSIKGSNTCVYVGLYARDYDRMGFKDLPQITKLHITGTGEAVVSNRISYLFDLKGASVTVDTGCVSMKWFFSWEITRWNSNFEVHVVWKYGCPSPSLPESSDRGVKHGHRWRHTAPPSPRSGYRNEHSRVSLLCFPQLPLWHTDC